MAKNPLTERDVYLYLIETLQPIYADLVATLGEKPTQVVFQFEAAFVHLAVARTRPEVSQVNIEKAMGHLQRAALDASKILWLHNKRELSRIVGDENLRRFCVNLPESSLMEDYQHAEQLGRKARQLEITSTGVDPNAAIAAYYEAAMAFFKVLQHVDPQKVRSFQRFSLFSILRDHGLGFSLGVLASLLASFLWTLW